MSSKSTDLSSLNIPLVVLKFPSTNCHQQANLRYVHGLGENLTFGNLLNFHHFKKKHGFEQNCLKLVEMDMSTLSKQGTNNTHFQ